MEIRRYKNEKIRNIVQCRENIIKIGARDLSYYLFIIYKYDLLFTQTMDEKLNIGG